MRIANLNAGGPAQDAPSGEQDVMPAAQSTLAQRVAEAAGAADVLPAEHVTLMCADLPVRGRRRLQILPFALEDRVPVPVEGLHFALHPGHGAPALVAVVDRGVMSSAEGGRRLIPETMGLPAPESPQGQTVWAVWAEGERAVVRVSDGTGFAARIEQVEPLWHAAGSPELTIYGPAAPPGLAEAGQAVSALPDPDPGDLIFDLRQGEYASARDRWPRAARRSAAVVAAGLLAHLAIAGADAFALSRIAAEERDHAERLLEARLPGATPTLDLPAVMQRLVPQTGPEGSDFLPLIARSAAVFVAGVPGIELRRLSWDATSGEMLLTVTASSLENIQTVERLLTDEGLSAESGVATVADGMARADLRIASRP